MVAVTSGLVAAALVRCSPPALPPGPQALPTRIVVAHGAVVSLGTRLVDRAALVASLKELDLGTVIIESSASADGEVVNDRVAVAIALQRDLGADVFIGGYQPRVTSGTKMEALLEKDPTFSRCYPTGPELDPETSVIDKIRRCSQDVSKRIADALDAAHANEHVGCFITYGPELTAALSAEGRRALRELLRDSAGPCAAAKRFVGISPLLTTHAADPDATGVFFRESLQDSGVNYLMLQDGVGTFDPKRPRRAVPFYQGLRNAFADREPTVHVWSNVEAFDCEPVDGGPPSCIHTHPTTGPQLIDRMCSARARVDGIVTTEYLSDLGGVALSPVELDASTDADIDASTQLHRALVDWTDAGAPCP